MFKFACLLYRARECEEADLLTKILVWMFSSRELAPVAAMADYMQTLGSGAVPLDRHDRG